MRRLSKTREPEVLAQNRDTWLADFQKDRTNKTCRYRYRHKDIKEALKTETAHKCVYCESKIGHNTPGDVEHKVPTSHRMELHFDWGNLTIACTECNRRKNDYYSESDGFVDPYDDDVEAIFIHCGPVVRWEPGNARAEIAVKTLGLLGTDRVELVLRKIEKLREVADLSERQRSTSDPMLKRVLERQLHSLGQSCEEYSAMVMTELRRLGAAQQGLAVDGAPATLPSSVSPAAGSRNVRRGREKNPS